MKLLRFGAAGIIIFGLLIALILGFYNGLQEEFGFAPNDVRVVDGQNVSITEQLDDLNLIEKTNDIVVDQLDLQNPSSSFFDLLGALLAAALGGLKFIADIFLLPLKIVNIIVIYFGLPLVLVKVFIGLITLFLIFILISAVLRGEV